jgi:hypothetical protein
MKGCLNYPRIQCLVFAVLLFAHMLTAAKAETRPSGERIKADAIVMTVDGEPVSVAEYILVMEGRTSEVFNYFNGKSGLEDHLGYWKDDGKPENPILRLRSVVTEEFRRIKTIQGLAKKKGLMKDVSFAAFSEGLIKENARRQKAVDNNQVIYGPRQYQAYRYYYFQLKDLEQALLEAFQKEPTNAIPDPEIERFYADNKAGIGDKPLSDLRAQIARVLQAKNFEKRIEGRIADAKVVVDTPVLNTIAPRHDPIVP